MRKFEPRFFRKAFWAGGFSSRLGGVLSLRALPGNKISRGAMQVYFLYARKSTDEEDRQILSIELQIHEPREYARREGLTIIEEFVEAKTAKEPGRPVFNLMMEQIEAGKAQGVLAWHPDRLARNSVDGGRIIYLVDTARSPTFAFPRTVSTTRPRESSCSPLPSANQNTMWTISPRTSSGAFGRNSGGASGRGGHRLAT